MFCNCVFPSAEALEIAKDPSSYEFLNEEQPEYIPENSKEAKNVASYKKAAPVQKKKEKVIKPKYQIEKKSIPDIKLSMKQIAVIILICVVIFAGFLALMLPKTINRDKQRELITQQFQQDETLGDLKKSIDFEEGFDLTHMDNSHLDLITDEKLTKEQVREIFKVFSDVRSSALGETGEVNYAGNSLRIAVPEQGGYLIENKTLADLDDLNNIVELP